MPLVDITNPAVIIFLIECYQKEARLRANWVHKNLEKIEQAATLTREPTNYYEKDVLAANMKAGMPAIRRDHIIAGFNRRKVAIRDGVFIPGVNHLRAGHSIVDVKLGTVEEDPKLARKNTDLLPDPIMRPVDPELCEIILKPKPEYGRVPYLAKRAKVKPEKRFYFAECSSWEYGWRMGDSGLHQKPQFGRCWHLTKALRTRVGPQPDPPHYKSSESPATMKCTM